MQTVNKVAVNTLFQYIQLFLSVTIGLFSIRILLQSLGDVNYGIYNLVAGIIGLLSFMSASLSQTSIRYISVAIGEGNSLNIKKTFASCFSLHMIIAIGIVIILEIVGLLFLGFLNIPDERYYASQVVYQFMLLSLFFSLILTPFQAIVVAYEHFIFSSIWGIMDAGLKLLIAYYVSISTADKLIIYGVLMAFLVILDFCVFFIYSKKYFKESIKLFVRKPKEVKSVADFAGWSLCDVFSSIINRQGYAILFNSFFGPLMNTVYALAMQIESHIYTVSASVINTMKPQIMKSVGYGDNLRAIRLSVTAGKFGFTMMALISVPLIVMMPDVLRLWLKDFPSDTILFARMMILASMIEQLTRGLVYANQAFGNIKWFSIIVSSVRTSAMPLSLLCLLLGASPFVPIVVFLITEALGSLTRLIVMNRLYGMSVNQYFKQLLQQVVPPFLVSLVVCYVVYYFVTGISGMLLAFVLTVFVYLGLVYFGGLTIAERDSISLVVISLKNKIRK